MRRHALVLGCVLLLLPAAQAQNDWALEITGADGWQSDPLVPGDRLDIDVQGTLACPNAASAVYQPPTIIPTIEGMPGWHAAPEVEQITFERGACGGTQNEVPFTVPFTAGPDDRMPGLRQYPFTVSLEPENGNDPTVAGANAATIQFTLVSGVEGSLDIQPAAAKQTVSEQPVVRYAVQNDYNVRVMLLPEIQSAPFSPLGDPQPIIIEPFQEAPQIIEVPFSSSSGWSSGDLVVRWDAWPVDDPGHGLPGYDSTETRVDVENGGSFMAQATPGPGLVVPLLAVLGLALVRRQR